MFNEGLIVALWHRETLQRCFDVCSLLLVLFPGVFVSWCCVNPRGPSVILCMYHYPACVCVCVYFCYMRLNAVHSRKHHLTKSLSPAVIIDISFLFFKSVQIDTLMFVNISTYSFWVARLERKKKPSVNDLLTFITDIFITKWVKY